MSQSTAPAPQLTGEYTIDPEHSRIGFTARHAMVTKVRGTFAEFEGSALIAEDAAQSSTRLSIRAASFTTNHQQRDDHVRGADFLDVDTFPALTFSSTTVELVDGSTYRVTGDLTIRDVTQSITVDFESTGVAKDPFGAVRAGFEGSTTINRKDFGITFNAALETGGVLVSEKIGLEFDVSAIRKA